MSFVQLWHFFTGDGSYRLAGRSKGRRIIGQALCRVSNDPPSGPASGPPRAHPRPAGYNDHTTMTNVTTRRKGRGLVWLLLLLAVFLIWWFWKPPADSGRKHQAALDDAA